MLHAGHRFPEDFATIISIVWEELQASTRDRKHGFHTASLATLDASGQPDNRTCTIRRVEPISRLLMTHADIRSPKAIQIMGDPRVAWVFYDVERRLQVRARGIAHVERDSSLAEEQWDRTSVVSRRCYMAPHAPSSVTPILDVNIAEWLRPGRPSIEQTLPARDNFCVLVTRVDDLDAMELAADGHRRAGFTWNEQGSMRTEWRAP